MVGENTTLYCHLSPERNAEDMEVRWFRWRLSPAVLVYKDHQEREEEQMAAYQGRTTFVSTDISKGRVALIIHNVTAYDNGIYYCYFQEGRSYDQAIMRLMVATDVVLDPDTAHPELFLSDDQRSVRRGASRQSVPDNPERFDCQPCVLGRESFSSGKHYWEVEVENVMVWAIGVCRDSVERKGEALLVPQNGFWTLEMFGSQYRALSSPETIIPLKERLHRVAIFLDWEAGDVSFYNTRDSLKLLVTHQQPVALARLDMAVSPNRQVSCLLAFLLQLLVLQLPTLDSAPFHVTAPQEPVLALVGSDVELTCLFSTNESAEHVEELRWFRQTRSPAVLLYRAGQEQEDQQMTEYRGRATLVTDGLPDGRATLLIRGVRVSDQGEYRCSFKDNDNSEEASAHLKVAALGSDPHISMEVKENGQIQLECTSSGWFPEPEAQWRTPSGGRLPFTAESRNHDEEGLFTVAASVIITDSSIKNVSCCIQNHLLGQEKEVEISIPVDVTLDPDTAHPHLFLYEDSKSVCLEDSRQILPDRPERFDSWPCVLGRETFTSGRHYWEVEVGDRTDWAIGVCRENVVKKGFDPMTPDNGFWAVELYGNGYWALTPLRTPLRLAGPPRRVGVFLDYESGDISFYNMSDGTLIYTFPSTSFSGPLRPFFCLWSSGKKPLTICPTANGPGKITVIANAQDSIPLSPLGEGSASGETDTLHSKLIPFSPSQVVP
ncbi:Butyrophilin subfamily 1 member A1 [Cricetulus griseus]|uniref:Butyrophilin subfamily 1 member A1 n=1 Tax=Cricetulus griseus TaxID=10029 RepID=G3HDR9_CRIGR|nr:Butyrophilin subfamily 1 member A1 [Cricetulus griseus]